MSKKSTVVTIEPNTGTPLTINVNIPKGQKVRVIFATEETLNTLDTIIAFGATHDYRTKEEFDAFMNSYETYDMAVKE